MLYQTLGACFNLYNFEYWMRITFWLFHKDIIFLVFYLKRLLFIYDISQLFLVVRDVIVHMVAHFSMGVSALSHLSLFDVQKPFTINLALYLSSPPLFFGLTFKTHFIIFGHLLKNKSTMDHAIFINGVHLFVHFLYPRI